MSTQEASSSSPTSSSTTRWKFDVFLSFRGVDTRKGFTDHLYAALQQKGISTFRDDEKLEKGKSLSPELLKAIEESRFAIIILSKNYASSTWCLDELAKIVRCMKDTKLTVFPVFYDVDPSDVRNQTRTFEKSFVEHEECFKENIEKVETWKAALREVANLSGWHLQDGLRHKKVLLVLDDVNELEQLKCLAGENGWFGSGSWIIITTRDKHLLRKHEVHKIYEPSALNRRDALKLFCLKAFKNDQPREDYKELSYNFVHYARGLPLALVTLALVSIEKIPKREIYDILRVSFDGLEEMWKEIFLDIACFFGGKRKDRVIEILEKCGFEATIGIDVLIDNSLLTIEKENLWMHSLLQEMGRQIVLQESCQQPGKRSRLWHYDDLFHVLTKDTAPKTIQAVMVNISEAERANVKFEAFTKAFSEMCNLRLLIIHYEHIPNYFNHDLSFFELFGYSSKCLSSSFQPKELVELDLWSSKIKYIWKGVKWKYRLTTFPTP
ncbi:TMV resistance protein N-like [Fagus crenata]